jgi:hypothetical protein
MEMNAGTCWGKNTIDPSGLVIEKPASAVVSCVFGDKTSIIPQTIFYRVKGL